MSESGDELIARADALLARWRSGTPPADADSDYPVLTEALDSPEAISDPAAPSSAEGEAAEPESTRDLIEAIEAALAPLIDQAVHERVAKAAELLRAEAERPPGAALSEALRAELRRALQAEIDRLRGTARS